MRRTNLPPLAAATCGKNMPVAMQLGSAAQRYRLGSRKAPHVSSLIELDFPDQAPRPPARRTRLEAVLLLANEPLSLRKLAQLANLSDATEARTLLEELGRVYDARGCAFQLQALAGGYQLRTRATLAPWLRSIASHVEGERLTTPAMETLAVVAYRQPVVRAEVEAIRGVQCGELLRQLMERDLLRMVGRSEELGRPILYGTTKRFLRLFGLKNLDELPRAAELRSGDLPNEPGAEGRLASIPLAES